MEVMVAIMRRLSPEAKLRQVCALTKASREAAMAGLRSRYPEASEEELRRRFPALVLDAETVLKVYGWDPREEGY